MKIGIIKEADEPRVALVPDVAKQLIGDGHDVLIAKGAGAGACFFDEQYTRIGGQIASQEEVLQQANMLITYSPLTADALKALPQDALTVSLFRPFDGHERLSPVADAGLSAVSLDMIPRITLAQAMDVLSSMASIAGYKAVIKAANMLPRYFPMLTTAAGSIPPAKVLVIGAGVAGLQAIATARRLGSVVEAFDTRTAAREEVQSLGAKFIEVEGARDDKSAGGYAVEQTEEYKQKQKELIYNSAVKSDVIVTTAQLRGKPAPKLITQQMVEAMKPGSVIVDLASSTGGNCELTEDDKTVVVNDVTILGNSNLSTEVPMHASQLFSKNVLNLLKVFIKDGQLHYDMENEIVKSSLVVKEGKILTA